MEKKEQFQSAPATAMPGSGNIQVIAQHVASAQNIDSVVLTPMEYESMQQGTPKQKDSDYELYQNQIDEVVLEKRPDGIDTAPQVDKSSTSSMNAIIRQAGRAYSPPSPFKHGKQSHIHSHAIAGRTRNNNKDLDVAQDSVNQKFTTLRSSNPSTSKSTQQALNYINYINNNQAAIESGQNPIQVYSSYMQESSSKIHSAITQNNSQNKSSMWRQVKQVSNFAQQQ